MTERLTEVITACCDRSVKAKLSASPVEAPAQTVVSESADEVDTTTTAVEVLLQGLTEEPRTQMLKQLLVANK